MYYTPTLPLWLAMHRIPTTFSVKKGRNAGYLGTELRSTDSHSSMSTRASNLSNVLPNPSSDNDISTVSMDSEWSSRRASTSNITSNSGSGRFSMRFTTADETKPLKPAQFLESQLKVRQEFPVSNLRFDSLGLVGRDDELQILQSCLQKVTSQASSAATTSSTHSKPTQKKNHSQLVLISGDSGTGKTALACALAPSIHKAGGVLLQGNFDL